MSEPSPEHSSTSGFVTGRVLRVDAKVVHVDVGGEVRHCAIRGKLFENLGRSKNPITVGDIVEVDPHGDPQSIESVHARRNKLSRIASAHDPREQVLFANVDQMFVVASIAKPGFSSNRTDRILAACLHNEIPVTLILNKVDLDKQGVVEDLVATYEAAGIPLLQTCAVEGPDAPGIDDLRAALDGRVSAFYGASGVGKSTLLNTLDETLKIKVGKISKYWTAGKHTTSYSQMHRLAIGDDSWVIDTPGIRVFRLFDVKAGRLRDLFPEFAKHQRSCHFPNCSHDHEPDCAVYDAVESGEIAPTRFASYLELLDEERGAPEGDGEGPSDDEPTA